VLALVALGCWYAQRSAVTPLPDAPSRNKESFFANGRAWLLAIFFGLGTAS
jgi:CP family cyanate transporter-like MFS transporter